MTKYLLLSGPPGAGKDTIGTLLRDGFKAKLDKFAAPLMLAAESLGFSMREEDKDQRIGPGGLSRREFQIAFSEQFAKPMFGNDIFGRALGMRNVAERFVVVTDSGFREEAVALAQAVGPHNVRRLHLHREGHDYSRDSRSDWDAAGTGILRVDLTNDVPLEELRTKLLLHLQPWADWLEG